MKLTRKKMVDSLSILEQGGTVYKAKKTAGISLGYMYRLWNEYKRTGNIPERSHLSGRPLKQINPSHELIVEQAYKKYRICASRLTLIIKRDYNVQIPVYTIHKILLKQGFAKNKEKKDVRKKDWIRYERRHSLTAIHLDWLYHKELEIWVLPVIDDSSRKLLSLIESNSATTDLSIMAVAEALKHGEIQQCITDHGTQFIKDESKTARFTEFLRAKNIQHILCRIKHPQSNGKSEKFGHIYQIHRTAFKTKEEFIKWYNEIKPHMSLNERTPEEVYQERKKDGRKYYT
jgi:putative transposase